jgi:hypothetical protein
MGLASAGAGFVELVRLLAARGGIETAALA